MKITLLVVVLAMEPVFVYAGFFAPRVFVRFSVQTAAFMLPLLALALGYAIWQEATAVRRLAEHIDPYSGITSTLWVPPIPGTGASIGSSRHPTVARASPVSTPTKRTVAAGVHLAENLSRVRRW